MKRLDRDGLGEAIAERTVRLERVLPGPAERIWSYLTDSEKRRQWLARGEMEPRPGGRVEHLFRHHELSDEVAPAAYAGMADSPAMVGEVTEWDPPRLLAYRWPGDGGASEVTFELFPEGADVVLVVTHRRLADRQTMISVAAGWDAHIGILIDRLNGDTPRGFWSTHARLSAQYERIAQPDAKPGGGNGSGWLTGETVHFERMLPGPAARLWEHLTGSRHLPVWFGSEDMEFTIEPGVGGGVSLMGGYITGAVREWQPHKRLAYSWNLAGVPAPETIVTFELDDRADGVLLSLSQGPIASGFQAASFSGWHTFLDRLEAMLDGRNPGDAMEAMHRHRGAYAVGFPEAPPH